MKQRGGLFSHLGRVAGEKAMGYSLDCAAPFHTLHRIAALKRGRTNPGRAGLGGNHMQCSGRRPPHCMLWVSPLPAIEGVPLPALPWSPEPQSPSPGPGPARPGRPAGRRHRGNRGPIRTPDRLRRNSGSRGHLPQCSTSPFRRQAFTSIRA